MDINYTTLPDGGRVAYRCRATRGGTPVALLHGWGCDGSVFAGIAQEAAGLDPVSIDLPGFGASSEPASSYDQDDYAATVTAVMSDLGFDRFGVLAHSFGCRPALSLAASGSVTRLMMTGAAGLRPRRSRATRARIACFRLLRRLLPAAIAATLGSRLGSEDYRRSTPAMRRVMTRNLAIDLEPLLPQIACPVFLLWGASDTATPVWMMEKMRQQIPDCGCHVVAGGHFAFAEHPALTAAVMRSFFGGAA